MKNTLVSCVVTLIASIGFVVSAAAVTSTPVHAAECGGVDTAYLSCESDGKGSKVEDSAVWQILELVLNIMIGGVAIAAVGGIVYAAIIYASAQDNASQVQKSREMIQNVVIGLVLFLVMWAGLQYLIPGGVF